MATRLDIIDHLRAEHAQAVVIGVDTLMGVGSSRLVASRWSKIGLEELHRAIHTDEAAEVQTKLDTHLDELEKLARAATPGEWGAEGAEIYLGVTYRPDPNDEISPGWASAGVIYDEGGHSEADAAYIAAASPSVVLDLINRLRASERADTEKWSRG